MKNKGKIEAIQKFVNKLCYDKRDKIYSDYETKKIKLTGKLKHIENKRREAVEEYKLKLFIDLHDLEDTKTSVDKFIKNVKSAIDKL